MRKGPLNIEEVQNRRFACLMPSKMNAELPLVSVLTPTWNRADYLERVWRALNNQSYFRFEWIVANDGSEDHTDSVVRCLAERSRFPITLITANVRVGKARMDNEAVAAAHGELILWNDSDDYLLPDALEKLVAAWTAIPETERCGFVAVSALCATETGGALNRLEARSAYDSTWNDMAEKDRLSGDMSHLISADVLRVHRFPEVDFVVPESVVWSVLAHLRVRVLPEVVMMKEYRAPNAVSFTRKQEYCRGRAYAMATSEAAKSGLLSHKRALAKRLWRVTTFIRYSVHGELTVAEQFGLWRGVDGARWFVPMYPVGYLLALKDRLQGKVRYTHREFLVAAGRVSIRCESLPAAVRI